jgi:hypothetical protein
VNKQKTFKTNSLGSGTARFSGLSNIYLQIEKKRHGHIKSYDAHFLYYIYMTDW